jgi:hypothetical protein
MGERRGMLAALARMRGFAGDAAQARYICSLEALLAPRAENSNESTMMDS